MEGMPYIPVEERFKRPRLDLEQVTTPEKFLKAVDFNVVNDLFDELTKKAAGENREVHTTGHRVVPENISFNRPHLLELLRLRAYEPRAVQGTAIVPEGNIELTWDLKDAEKHPDYRAIALLRTLLHESAHIRGAYREEGWERGSAEKGDWEKEERFQAGIQNSTLHAGLQRGAQEESHGLSLNEAITETIANDILPEYLVRTGNTGFLKDPRLVKELGAGAYIADRFLLQLTVELLAEEFGVDRDVVWKGFVQAYMTGSMTLPQLLGDIAMEFDAGGEGAILLNTALVSLVGSESASNVYEVDDLLRLIQDRPDLRRTIMERLDHAIDSEKFGHALGLR